MQFCFVFCYFTSIMYLCSINAKLIVVLSKHTNYLLEEVAGGLLLKQWWESLQSEGKI